MKKIKEVKVMLTYLLIVALVVLTVIPTTAFGQSTGNVKVTNPVVAQPVENELSTVVSGLQKERANTLLNNRSTGSQTSFTPDLGKEWSQNAKSLRAQKQNGSWIKRNWWVFPVLAGVGVGIYYLANRSNGGILCNDGTYSQAENTQGACSWHGGIAK